MEQLRAEATIVTTKIIIRLNKYPNLCQKGWQYKFIDEN